MRNKKGTGQRPAPNTTFYYTRVSRLCLLISIISVIMFVIAYHFRSVAFIGLSAGTLITSLIIHMALNPLSIEDDDEF
jgi:hypothetical protein